MGYTDVGENVFSTVLNEYVSVDSLAHTPTFNSDGTIATVTITDGQHSWIRTYSYASNNLSSISPWVRQ